MFLNALIIEDEPAASRRLQKLIKEIDPFIEIVATLDSISSAISWFRDHAQPDLLFLDIHLGDGLSFNIFEKLDITCPVIFTTAYDEYAIKAFKLNSIDYLLKPIKREELKFSIEKLKKNTTNDTIHLQTIQSIFDNYRNREEQWRKRFMVSFGDKIKAIEVLEIAYFVIIEKSTFLTTFSNDSYGINFSLEQLDEILDPQKFYRVNRKFIVNYEAIKNMWSYSRSRVKIELQPQPLEDVIVSTDRSSGFKEWLNQ